MDTEALGSLMARLADGQRTLTDGEARLLREAVRLYPYCGVAAMMSYGHDGALNDSERTALRRRLGLLLSDPRSIAAAAHGDEWRNFYPERPETSAPETNDVIDTFLRTYGSTSPQEEALLEKMIFNPAPDYAEVLAREEQENLPAEPADTDSNEGKIAAFILSRHPAAHSPEPMPGPEEPAEAYDAAKAPVSKPDDEVSDSLLSESLARIFIRQGRYERAFDIISSLSLKFPKKSAYFADQLRFLQKLIINKRHLEGLQSPQDAHKNK